MKASFNKYESLPVKVRILIAQRALLDLGYDVVVNGQRDKKTIKSLCDVQKQNDLSANGIVCETTYELLNINKKHFSR